MEYRAALSILYDTLDSLVAIKIELRSHDSRRAALMGDDGGRIGAEVDHAIDNVRAAIHSLEQQSHRALARPLPAERNPDEAPPSAMGS